MDPNEIAQAASQLGPGAPWGFGIGSVIALGWFLDKFFTNRKGDNQRVLALTEDVARISDRLRDETKRADDNQDRADKLGEMVNAQVRESSENKAEIAKITERLDWITKQNETLVKQNDELRGQLNELLSRGLPK